MPRHRRQVMKTIAARAEAAEWLDRKKEKLREALGGASHARHALSRGFPEHWLENVAAPQVRSSTLRSYRQMMTHLVEEFGDKP